MRVPVADIMQFARKHGVDIGLLASPVRLEEGAPALVFRPRARRLAHDNAVPDDPREKLSASFAMPEVKLTVPVEMVEDGSLELDHFARGADGIV